MAAAAHNLGRLMRLLSGIGKPKSLQGAGGLAALAQLLRARLANAWARRSDLTSSWDNSWRQAASRHNLCFAI
jgi:hypothetical protein